MKTLDNFIYEILVCVRGPGSNTDDAEQRVAVVSRFISAVDCKPTFYLLTKCS